MTGRPGTVAIVTRRAPSSRLQPIFEALAGLGVGVESVVFDEDSVDEVRRQLLALDGVLVWVDPITDERDRSVLDALLRDVSAGGAWVSAHPDVILKMGTKEVLYRTRELGWGGDTHLYETMEQFEAEFPSRLAASGRRVIKQNRGNAGIGVWKIRSMDAPDAHARMNDAAVLVQHALPRDTILEEMPLAAFMARCAEYFSGGGRIVDQRFEPRVAEGMIRCYMVRGEVSGFSTQSPAPGAQPSAVFGLPSTKTMFEASEPRFARLRMRMESDWVPAMQGIVDVAAASLPLLWDADFLLGPSTATGDDTYVLCEINVSCVTPFPASVVPKLVAAVAARLERRVED